MNVRHSEIPVGYGGINSGRILPSGRNDEMDKYTIDMKRVWM